MNSLKELAKNSIKSKNVGEGERLGYEEKVVELSEQVLEQRLLIMELEENYGAVAQENAWLWEEIQMLKMQIWNLENMVYGEQMR